MAEPQDNIPVERAGTPDIVADDALNLYASNGVVRITFSRTDPDYQGGFQTVITGRVSLSLKSAQTLAAALQDFLTQQNPDPESQAVPLAPEAF